RRLPGRAALAGEVQRGGKDPARGPRSAAHLLRGMSALGDGRSATRRAAGPRALESAPLKVLACALLLCALPARAFVRTRNSAGVCIWWSAHGHSFQVDALGTPDVTGAAAADAVRRSFATWSAASCSDLAFAEQPISTSAADRLVGYFPSAANHNLVLFRTRNCRDAVPSGTTCTGSGGCSNLYDCWDQGDGVIASTTTTSDARSGEILDSDIELNAAVFRFTAVDGLPCQTAAETGCVRTDVQNTVTHEAGHSLGLDHSPDHPEAAMYPTGPPGEVTKRV